MGFLDNIFGSGRNRAYNEADNYDYGVMPEYQIENLVTKKVDRITIDFGICSVPVSSLISLLRKAKRSEKRYHLCYCLIISSESYSLEKKLFCRNYSESGFEEIDSSAVERGLSSFFRPLVEHLSANNFFSIESTELDNLFRTIATAEPILKDNSSEGVCYKKRVTIRFTDAETAEAQKEAARLRNRESALFEGQLKWMSFRFHFKYGKGLEKVNRTKLALTVINSNGTSMSYDVFDFRCSIQDYRGWYESWVSFVNTEGKIKITQLLSRLAGYHECVSSLVEWESINRIINKVAGRADFEVSFNFSQGSKSGSGSKEKSRSQKRTEKNQASIWLGLLGLESMPDSLDEMKKAYRNACFAFHPDRFTDTEKKKWAEEQLKRITNAFDELSKFYA